VSPEVGDLAYLAPMARAQLHPRMMGVADNAGKGT
jgi:hypothetical protein